RLARSVRPEESVDRAARHRHRQVIDDRAPAKALGQAAHVDGGFARGGHHFLSVRSVAVTGWPTRRPSGFSGSASTRNTSLFRSSSLKITGGVYSAALAIKLMRADSPPAQPSQATPIA